MPSVSANFSLDRKGSNDFDFCDGATKADDWSDSSGIDELPSGIIEEEERELIARFSESRYGEEKKMENGCNEQCKHIHDGFEYPKPDMRTFENQETADAPFLTDFLVKFTYFVKFMFARIREYLQANGWRKSRGHNEIKEHEDFVPLMSGQESLFIRNIYRVGSDVCSRVVASVPGTIMNMANRVTSDYGWTYQFTGVERKVLNMGSYNYLGFAQNRGPCAEAARKAIDRYGVSTCSATRELGSQRTHKKLETLMTEYLGVEAVMCFPMGFNTNAMNIPALIGKGCLIMSDALNHASLVLGCRLSGALIKVFKHCDAKDLERKLRQAIVDGQPKTHRPYKKVLIVVEGIYSMEGTISPIPAIIDIKKKYGAYLFVDEAHSIGALGKTGKGVAEYFDCDPRDIDILMGTLTKSFAAAGGYIGGSKSLIAHLRIHSHDGAYGSGMPAAVVEQIISSMSIIMGKDGTDEGQRRINLLMRNTHYFRRKLKQLGFLTYGHMDSPVVPFVMFYCTKTLHFIRETFRRNLAIVGVCFPATPMTKSRARFCLSAAHTKDQLDWAAQICSEVADLTNVKYGLTENLNMEIPY